MRRQKPAPRPMPSWYAQAGKALDLWKPVGLMLVAGVGSLTAYLFTPLQAAINSWLYPTGAEVKIYSQQKELFEDDVYSVDVFVSSLKWNPVPQGIVEIQYPSEQFDLLHTSAGTMMHTNVIDGSAKVTPDGGIRLYAHSPGAGVITAILRVPQLGNKTFRGETAFVVKESKEREFPTLNNYSGKWVLEINGRFADVKLEERNANVTGEYTFRDSKRRGNITGVRDSTLAITLTNPNNPLSRYRISADCPLDATNGIELRSTDDGPKARRNGSATFEVLKSGKAEGTYATSRSEEVPFRMTAMRK